MSKCKENYCQTSRVQKCQGYCPRPGPTQGVTPLDVSWFTEEVSGNIKNTRAHVIRNEAPNYWCNSERPVGDNDPTWMSSNQKLGNGVNPKTHIPPLVVPPSHDLSFWKADNLITHSRTNQETQREAYLSGYAVSTCCGNLEGKYVVPQKGPQYQAYVGGLSNTYMMDPDMSQHRETQENFMSPKPAGVIPPNIPSIPVTNTVNNFTSVKEGFMSPKPAGVIPPNIPSIPVTNTANHVNQCGRENYSTLETVDHPHGVMIAPNEPGWVNTSCGYNPEQVFDADLPSNMAAGNCEQDKNMKQYNEQLFTQTIQPGVYTRSQVNEPINANIGISFQQQFQPQTCKRDEKGLQYLNHDPRIIEPAIYEPNMALVNEVNESNVYDPRFHGYGTSYRAYTEPMLGQTRFAYDDINAIRMPNYVVRSKIDFLPYADQYGPMKPGQEEGNPLTGDIRGLAQDSWMRDSITFRNDLTERLMRKVNNEQWQRRQAPKNTMSCRRC